MANPVVHFEIAGLDEARTKAFYTSVFEWEVGEVPGMEGYNMVNAGRINGMGIDGGIMKAPPRPSLQRVLHSGGQLDRNPGEDQSERR